MKNWWFGMKNIEQGDSDKIPPTPTHSNFVIKNSNPPKEYDQNTLTTENIPGSPDLHDGKEKRNSNNVIANQPSISHPKVIDILDNQLEQL